VRLKLLLVDLDGTLVDSRRGITASITHALVKLGRPMSPEDSLVPFIGLPLGHVFRTILRTEDPELVQLAVNAYRERFATTGIHENAVYPGIPCALRALSKLGVRLSLVTSKPAEYADRIVRQHSLEQDIDNVFGPSLSALYESKGALIRRALSASSFGADEVVMVGDRPEDVAGARENGVASIAVTWGYGAREELDCADHVVASPLELVELAGVLVR
jgi:phosphoglycolate phosphatase